MDQAVATERTYDTDFYAWADRQAAMPRAGRFDEMDIGTLAEEIDCYRGRRRGLTIREQRDRLRRHPVENPSLKAQITEFMGLAYPGAAIAAIRETGSDDSSFPTARPYDPARLLNDDFLPN